MGEVGAMASLREVVERRGRERRRHIHKIVYVVVAVIAIATLPFLLIEAYRAFLRLDPEWRFVEDVALRPAPGSENPVVVRWTTPARVTLVDATAADEAFIGAFLATLGEVFGESGASVRLAEDGASNVQVYFATPESFDRLAANFGADPDPPGIGFYLVWPNAQFDVAAAVVVIGAHVGGAERRWAIVHQLLHVLGLRGHSAAFPDSVLFANGERRSLPTAVSAIDRKLLRFLHRNLASGDQWLDLRAAYERSWETP